MIPFRPAILLLVIGFVAGLGLGYRVYRPAPAPQVVDHAHPAEPTPGGGVLVEEQPAPKPATSVPGKTVVRTVYVTVQPDKPVEDGYSDDAAVREVEKPVRLTMSLVRTDDGSLRVEAKAEGGKIIGALDIPVAGSPVVVQPKPPARELKWAAGYEYARTSTSYAHGAFVDRDLGPLRIGATVSRQFYDTAREWSGSVKLGIRF